MVSRDKQQKYAYAVININVENLHIEELWLDFQSVREVKTSKNC